jgi:hypothetical protein
VVRNLTYTLALCALPAFAGCGSAGSAAYDPGEQLLTTTQRRDATTSARSGGPSGPEGPADRTWMLIAEYRCPLAVHADKPHFERPATAAAACKYCNDGRCMPEMVQMRRRERKAVDAPAEADSLPTAAGR